MTRIVLADDHPFLRRGVEEALYSQGITVAASVDDGRAALEAIARENPDVVVLDVRMPEMDGVAVLESLRQAGDHRPVVLLTAELEDEPLLRAMSVGVDAIVFKHGDQDRLRQAVEAVAAGQRFIEAELLERAAQLFAQPARVPLSERLSARELQIARGVAAGQRNRDIAAEVGMTEGSVKVYLHRIYERLGIENRTELAILVLNEGNAGEPPANA